MKSKIFGAVLGTALLGGARAADGALFGETAVGGNGCSPSNVEVYDFDDSLVVLLQGLGVSMPEGEWGDGLTVRKACAVRVAVDVPPGKRLKRLRQVYSGGMAKSGGSSAQLALRYNVGSLTTRTTSLVWRKGEVIGPDDPTALFEHDQSVRLPEGGCGEPTTFGMNVTLTGARSHYWESLIGGLDYLVAAFVHRLDLIPELETCSPE